jgi:hypothetical protein
VSGFQTSSISHRGLNGKGLSRPDPLQQAREGRPFCRNEPGCASIMGFRGSWVQIPPPSRYVSQDATCCTGRRFGRFVEFRSARSSTE